MGLLTRTRQINAMLQKTSGRSVNFKEMADTLSRRHHSQCVCAKPPW